ncbi:MAG: hypothetical protein GX564_12620 [Oligosphaeraceae bacterium]|nr:hypothetical protein [Oligosphaeraceae bacterium]
MQRKAFICLLILDLALLAESDNLLRNGSFEEPLTGQQLPPHWQLHLTNGAEGAVSLSEDWSSDGRKSLHLQKFNDIGSVTLVQSLHLQPNTEYILTLKGRRNAHTRWHYYSVRMPDTNIHIGGKIPLDQIECPPVRFISHPQKNLCYITLGLWGYEKPDPATVGELWADEIALEKISSNGILSGISDYYFCADGLRGMLFLPEYQGAMRLKLTAGDKVLLQKEQMFQTGENSFTLQWQDLPPGEAKFQIEAVPEGPDFSRTIMIMEKF